MVHDLSEDRDVSVVIDVHFLEELDELPEEYLKNRV